MNAIIELASFLESQAGLAAESRSFDPVGELLALPAQRPPELEAVDPRTLSPFQRVLLVIDGTVTTFVEAYTLEPVEVLRLHGEILTLRRKHPLLDLPAGAPVMSRQVLLQGRDSGTVYAYAASLLALGRLPADMLGKLEARAGSLGRALLDSRSENRRELLWDGREHLTQAPEVFRQLMGEELLTRTYRIIAGGQPVILINEKFPVRVNHQETR